MQIRLNKGKFAEVDADDYFDLLNYTWFVTKDGYAARALAGGRQEYMHKRILNPEKGFFTDHINRDKLDNRRDNLRAVTKQQNRFNAGKAAGCKNQRKGVIYDENRSNYQARLMVGGRYVLRKRFDVFEEACSAYEKAVLQYCGVYAPLKEGVS